MQQRPHDCTTMPEVLKVAVASNDGIAVNLHFGHAHHFYIYRVSSDGVTLLEQRQTDNYCKGGSKDGGNDDSASQSALSHILATIQDCNAVLVARIGDGPAQKLSALGIVPVDDYAYLGIHQALTDFYNNSLNQSALP